MSDFRAPPAPNHLATASQHLWELLADEYDLDEAALDVLRVALEARDRASTARRILKREGIVIEGRFGPVAHPAVTIEKQAAERYAKLLRDLGLTLPEGDDGPRIDRRYTHSKHVRKAGA
jgi:P27 family predicted phage terminase small subunit